MNDLAIRVDGLSKQYRIGGPKEPSGSLREAITHTVLRPFRRARGLLRGQAYAAADLEQTISALCEISFQVRQGEVLGIIGHNGAGKSTLLKILSRITEPTTGSADVYGRIGALLEVGTGFHLELTGRENVFLNGAILGMSRAEIQAKFDEIVDFAEVSKFIDTPVKHYSSGMALRLAFAVAAHLEPEILLIDEILAVGDFAFQRKCLGKMERVAGQGRTVLFVSHQMAMVANLCQRTILLQDGSIVMDAGTQEVIDRYLGSCREISRQPLDERLDRAGDGRFRFTRTWVEDSKGHETSVIQSGSPATIVSEFRVERNEQVTNVGVAFGIYGKNSQKVTDLFNLATNDFFCGPMPKRGRIRCEIPRVPLNSGVYTYNVLARSGMALEDHVINAGSFEIEPGDFFGSGRTVGRDHGVVLIDHRWDLEPMD